MSTSYVVSRWYRSPELLLSYDKATKAVDMWSVGCILAELITGEPLFKGNSPLKQLEFILTLLGTPPDIDKVKGSPAAKNFLRAYKKFDGIPFEQRFSSASREAIDLLKRLLTFDPEERISAQDAMRHEYFAEYFDQNDIIVVEKPISFEYESRMTDIRSIKQEAFKTILVFNDMLPKRSSQAFMSARQSTKFRDVIKNELMIRVKQIEKRREMHIMMKELMGRIRENGNNNDRAEYLKRVLRMIRTSKYD